MTDSTSPGALTRRIHQQLIDAGKMQASASPREADVAAPDAAAPFDPDQKPWQGTLEKKPWHYRVTAVIPHRDTPEHLELCIKFLEQQSERPYIMIIDTGSGEEALARVLALRSEAIEVHQLACHATQEYADVVCYAMDLAMSACRTEYLWCLHCDCFVTNRNLLAELLAKCEGGQQPVIGYESVSAHKHPECRGMVSHTCTLLHMPTIDRLDVTWSPRRLQTQMRDAGRDFILDAEMALNYRLRDRGIAPLILGFEQATGIERDANRVHLRSGTLRADLSTTAQQGSNWQDGTLTALSALLRRPRAERQRAQIRHLIYHITPFASNDTWLRNVRQLLRRMDVFNGRRVIAIATGHNMVDAQTVISAFSGHTVEFLLFDNNPTLRETVSTLSLLDSIASTAPDEATFYAHAKGVSTAGNPLGVTYWRNAMYHELLDFPDKIQALLTKHPMVGAFRRRFGRFPDGTPGGSWHFGGTFFWFRNDAIFCDPKWRERLPLTGWGTEAFPGLLFEYDDVASVYGDDVCNPYDPAAYTDPIDDEEGVPAQTDALKIELGGGCKPLRHGYLNIDLCDTADITIDFDALDFRLPFDDDSVLDVYSAHCLEHVRQLRHVVREIVRVCRIGARVEIRVPHWNSSMAMCFDHKHTIAEPQIDHWCASAVDFWFGGMPKRLKHFRTDYVPSGVFPEAKQLHPGWTDDQIMRFVPDACHEIAYFMHVVGINA